MAIPPLNFVDRVIFAAAAGGTGAFSEASAVIGFQTMEQAGAINGGTYGYSAQSSDLTQWEVGYGVWTPPGFTRNILFNSANNTNPINFSAPPQVLITSLGETLATSTYPLATSNLTFTVATTGNDNNPGTVALPFATQQRAMNVAAQFNYGFKYKPIINVGAGVFDYSATGLVYPELINPGAAGEVHGAGASLVTNKMGSTGNYAAGGNANWSLFDLGWDNGAVTSPHLFFADKGSTIGLFNNHQHQDSSGVQGAYILGSANGGTINWHGGNFTFINPFATFISGGPYASFNLNGGQIILPASPQFGYFWFDCQFGHVNFFSALTAGNYTNASTYNGSKYIISGSPSVFETVDGTFDQFPGTYAGSAIDGQTQVCQQTAFGGWAVPQFSGIPSAGSNCPKFTMSWAQNTATGQNYVWLNDNGVVRIKQIGRLPNVQTTNYTLHLTDQDGRVKFNSSSPVTCTVPTHASVPFPSPGTEIKITNEGSGTLTISAAGGVTGNNFGTLSQWQSAMLFTDATDVWTQTGC